MKKTTEKGDSDPTLSNRNDALSTVFCVKSLRVEITTEVYAPNMFHISNDNIYRKNSDIYKLMLFIERFRRNLDKDILKSNRQA
ncbi:hypothetical protein M153_3200005149 [Pseudoloma neurophilia]|uniref:Uncharacterized protein n=1 Tax=Pseudoloma neurophilia TaxID=146866 RepID=A0A0R0M3Z8_9MICR|nr:hypothetical protein M153_3200005149 [Pseudoloma neurophilia]